MGLFSFVGDLVGGLFGGGSSSNQANALAGLSKEALQWLQKELYPQFGKPLMELSTKQQLQAGPQTDWIQGMLQQSLGMPSGQVPNRAAPAFMNLGPEPQLPQAPTTDLSKMPAAFLSDPSKLPQTYSSDIGGLPNVPNWEDVQAQVQKAMTTLGDIDVGLLRQKLGESAKSSIAGRGIAGSTGAANIGMGLDTWALRNRLEGNAKATIAGLDAGRGARDEQRGQLLAKEGLRAEDYNRAMGNVLTQNELGQQNYNTSMQRFLTGEEITGRDFNRATTRALTAADLGAQRRSEGGQNFWNLLNTAKGLPGLPMETAAGLSPWANAFTNVASGAGNLAGMFANNANQQSAGLGSLLGMIFGRR